MAEEEKLSEIVFFQELYSFKKTKTKKHSIDTITVCVACLPSKKFK